MLKKYLRVIFVLMVKALSFIFYDNSYLQGKYFETHIIGWKWVLSGIWFQKILGFNRNIPFPVAPGVHISNYKNLILGKDVLNNFQSFGIYFQNFSGKITLGDGCYIGPNVGIITANHDFKDLDKHLPPQDVLLGKGCWIGMNSVILPGVELGEGVVVGAGSIVTQSFTKKNILIAGSPARFVKDL
jgi:acetyltransferase-like isoleucine patch superfamily enzyme